jgi:dolichol kinase
MDERGAFEIAAALLVLFWLIEAFRFGYPPFNRFLLWVTGWMARPHEASHLTSATWYMCATFLLACLWNLPVATLAIVICGLGDPAAAMIGRRFGRREIYYGRTIAGCTGFLVVSIGAGSAWLTQVYGFDVPTAFAWSVGGGLFGMLAELFSKRIDDNFSIPLAAAAGALLTSWLIG